MVRRKLIVVVACGLAATVTPAVAHAATGAVKQVIGSTDRGFCSIGGIGSGPPLGFVILSKADDHVSAVIALRGRSEVPGELGAPANGEWEIELDQTPLMGCGNFDGTIRTNAKGDGNAFVSDPFAPGNDGAFVRLDPLNEAAERTGIIASEGTELD